MKRVLSVAVIILAVGAIASADIGTVSISDSVDASGWTANIDLDVSTAGAAAPHRLDLIFAVGQIYYPFTWSIYTTTAYDKTTYFRSEVGANPTDSFDHAFSFSLTAPNSNAGLWGVWWKVGLYSFYTYSPPYWTSGYTYTSGPIGTTLPAPTYTPDPNAGGNPVPMSMPALVILGLLLAGVGVMILRRS